MDREQTDSMYQLFFLLAIIRRQTAKCFSHLYISDWCCVIEQLKWDLKRFMAVAISNRRREMAFRALWWCLKQIARLISEARLSQSSGIQIDLMAQLQASRAFCCLLMSNISPSSSFIWARSTSVWASNNETNLKSFLSLLLLCENLKALQSKFISRLNLVYLKDN